MFGGGGCGWRRECLESVAAGTGQELDQVRMMKLSFPSGSMLLSAAEMDYRDGGVRLKAKVGSFGSCTDSDSSWHSKWGSNGRSPVPGLWN